MRITILLIVGMILLGAFAAGCSSDDDDNDSGGGVPADDTAADDTGDDVADDSDDATDDTADDTADDTGDDTSDDTGDDDSVVCEGDQLPTWTYDETPTAGPLRLKAVDYDEWHETWHQPNYGSTVEVNFTDDTRTIVSRYGGWGDSCIWTGTYLASQALRYHVTKDAQAKNNAIRSVNALSRHLHVTGRDGFIARYVGPISDPAYGDVLTWCPTDDNCYFGEGDYDGDFFITNTSRDQYTGWFFGMSLAYDLVDDEDMRETIRADVTTVLDRLIADNWRIKDLDGIPTTAGPDVLPSQQWNWALIGYHITGEERFKAVFDKWADPDIQWYMVLSNISLTNRYMQHYGLNLGHQNFFNLMRLSKQYCTAHDEAVQVFRGQIHHWCDLSHNAFFTLIHMSQSGIEEEGGQYFDDQYTQMLQDITEFRDAPNDEYYLEPPAPAALDPLSVFLTDLEADYPWLSDIIGTAHYQALEAYPVPQQCSTDFLWQRNPWNIEPCGSDNPAHVNPGADYLVAYWMASAYKYITKDE